jgi:hypothetical protein
VACFDLNQDSKAMSSLRFCIECPPGAPGDLKICPCWCFPKSVAGRRRASRQIGRNCRTDPMACVKSVKTGLPRPRSFRASGRYRRVLRRQQIVGISCRRCAGKT